MSGQGAANFSCADDPYLHGSIRPFLDRGPRGERSRFQAMQARKYSGPKCLCLDETFDGSGRFANHVLALFGSFGDAVTDVVIQ
jgi:hypothetical protein